MLRRPAAPSFAMAVILGAGVVTLAGPADALTFRLPVVDPGMLWMDFVVHVDHDPLSTASQDCLAFDGSRGFPFCYDGHDGTDFMLDGGLPSMDAGSLEIVAAAAGEVLDVVDGWYDRCHADLATGDIDCDGYPMHSNHVVLRHEGGIVTFYHHMKKGSPAVAIGQQVACGQVLGLVGSSGMSSFPHLHFEVQDGNGGIIDPYAGPVSQPGSYWTLQVDPETGFPWVGCEGEEPPPPEDSGPADAGSPDSGPGPGDDAPDVPADDGPLPPDAASHDAASPDDLAGVDAARVDAVPLPDVAAAADAPAAPDLAAEQGRDVPGPGADLGRTGGLGGGCSAGGTGGAGWFWLAYALGALMSRRRTTSSRIRSSGMPG